MKGFRVAGPGEYLLQAKAARPLIYDAAHARKAAAGLCAVAGRAQQVGVHVGRLERVRACDAHL